MFYSCFSVNMDEYVLKKSSNKMHNISDVNKNKKGLLEHLTMYSCTTM